MRYGKLEHRWVEADELGPHLEKLQAELDRATKASGWNPKIIPLDGNKIAIDVCSHSGSDKLHSAHIVEYRDDSLLDDLPENAPRAVKAMYRKEVMLKHLRASEYWPFHYDSKAADEAWTKYTAASKT